jgi:hypothetical protein
MTGHVEIMWLEEKPRKTEIVMADISTLLWNCDVMNKMNYKQIFDNSNSTRCTRQ